MNDIAIARNLRESGFTDKQANAIAGGFAELRADIIADIADLRERTSKDIADLRENVAGISGKLNIIIGILVAVVSGFAIVAARVFLTLPPT